MARAYVELPEGSAPAMMPAAGYDAQVLLPDGWGPQRMAVVEWERAGHQVDVLRRFGKGPDRLLIAGQTKAPR